jgi:leucyl aminopeptidase
MLAAGLVPPALWFVHAEAYLLDIRLVPAPAGPPAVLALLVRPGSGRPAVDAGGVPLGDLTEGEIAAHLAEVRAEGTVGRADPLPRPGRRPKQVYLVGAGAGTTQDLRRAAATLARSAARQRRLVLALGDATPDQVRAVAEGLGLAAYRFSLASTPAPDGLRRVDLAVTDPAAGAAALDRGLATVRAVHLARDLTNTPSAEKSPAWLGAEAEKALTAAGARVAVHDEQWLAARRFGGVLAVGSGSSRPPRLIEARWRPRGANGARHVVLVGKGITFDTGGLSIKPNDAMVPMKTDMAGGATVLAAVQAAAALKLPLRVTALVPAAENHVSGSAYRPGDVIRHFGGRTSEVLNTDAEGRLVLADALAYAVARLAPDALVDVATLTGAAKVALGARTGALFTGDDEIRAGLLGSAAAAGENLWELPLSDTYLPNLESGLADAVNAAPGPGAIIAALFLRPFAGSTPWAHLDIAGPARAGADDAEISRGATGFGVRTLLRWLETLAG